LGEVKHFSNSETEINREFVCSGERIRIRQKILIKIEFQRWC